MARVKRRTLKKRGNMRKTRRQRKLSRKTMLRKRVRGGEKVKVEKILYKNDYLNEQLMMRKVNGVDVLYFIPDSESVSEFTRFIKYPNGEKIKIEFDKYGEAVFKNSDDKVITIFFKEDKVIKKEKESGVETIGQLVVGKLVVPRFTRIQNFFNPIT